MSLLARITDFQAGQIIQSQPFDDEFNQLVNALSGISQNKSIRVISNDSGFAVARFDQRGTNHIIEGYADGVEKFRVEKDGDIVGNGLTGAGGIYTFSQIPVFPASNPTDANQGVRKGYVDGKRSYFTIPFFIIDPSVNPPFNDPTQLPVISPPIGVTGMTLTRIGITRFAGSHNPGTAISFALIVNLATIATVEFNDTNNGSGSKYRSSAVAQGIGSADFAWIICNGRSGTILERSVTVWIEGYQNIAD